LKLISVWEQLPFLEGEQATVVEVPHDSLVFVSDPGKRLTNFEAFVPTLPVLRRYEQDGEVPRESRGAHSPWT